MLPQNLGEFCMDSLFLLMNYTPLLKVLYCLTMMAETLSQDVRPEVQHHPWRAVTETKDFRMLGPLSMMDNRTECQTSLIWDSAQKQETEAISTHMSENRKASSLQWSMEICMITEI